MVLRLTAGTARVTELRSRGMGRLCHHMRGKYGPRSWVARAGSGRRNAWSAVIVLPLMHARQVYRLRAPASGREALAPVEPGAVYVDRETGEEMRPVTRTLPLAPSESALLRTPENLRICRRCEQLIGLDVSDCPYCGLRQPALDGAS